MFSLTDPMNCPAQSAEEGKHIYGTQTTSCDQCRLYNNWARLMLTPVTNDIPAEQAHVFENMPKFLEVSKLSLDDMFVYMKKIEAFAAGMNLAYSQLAAKLRVNGHSKGTRAVDNGEAIKEQRIAQLQPKERKMLTDKEKAIKALVAIGIDEVTATASVEDRMSKAGRLIKI